MTGRCQDPLCNRPIEIVTAEGRIPAGRQDFKQATTEPQQGNIKGAAAQIINRDHAFRTSIQAIGNSRSGWLVEQSQDVDASQLGCVFCRLALSIVKISWDGNHDTVQFTRQSFTGPRDKVTNDFCRNLDRGHVTRACDNAGHTTFGSRELVRQLIAQCLHVFDAAAHQAFHRNNGVQRISRRARPRHFTHNRLVFTVLHNRWQHVMAVMIRQRFGNAGTD